MKCRILVSIVLITTYGHVGLANSQGQMESVKSNLDLLEKEIVNVLQRLQTESLKLPAKGMAFDQLAFCGKAVSEIGREIDVTVDLMTVASLVTEVGYKKSARPYVESQILYLSGRMKRSSELLAKNFRPSRDDQVTALCVRSRDIIRDAIPLASGLHP